MTKTIRVRIAVAVDPKGDWIAMGWKSADDETKRHHAVESLGIGERVSFIEADVPCPDEVAIEAEVVE